MPRFGSDSNGLRIECPHTGCTHKLAESEWKIQNVTDHMCPKGHFFRVEGETVEELVFYPIAPELAQKEYLV